MQRHLEKAYRIERYEHEEEVESENEIFHATRAHIEAMTACERAKANAEEAKRKLKECEAKAQEAKSDLAKAKRSLRKSRTTY